METDYNRTNDAMDALSDSLQDGSSEMSNLEIVFQQFCQDQGLDYEDFEPEASPTGMYFACGNEEYSVMDEYEAGSLFNDRMDDYIDECVLSEIPDHLRFYFDSAAFKRDVELSDGRGPTMATYDGHEHEYFAPNCNTAYYIYRTN
jgi:hypothetical protein